LATLACPSRQSQISDPPPRPPTQLRHDQWLPIDRSAADLLEKQGKGGARLPLPLLVLYPLVFILLLLPNWLMDSVVEDLLTLLSGGIALAYAALEGLKQGMGAVGLACVVGVVLLVVGHRTYRHRRTARKTAPEIRGGGRNRQKSVSVRQEEPTSRPLARIQDEGVAGIDPPSPTKSSCAVRPEVGSPTAVAGGDATIATSPPDSPPPWDPPPGGHTAVAGVLAEMAVPLALSPSGAGEGAALIVQPEAGLAVVTSPPHKTPETLEPLASEPTENLTPEPANVTADGGPQSVVLKPLSQASSEIEAVAPRSLDPHASLPTKQLRAETLDVTTEASSQPSTVEPLMKASPEIRPVAMDGGIDSDMLASGTTVRLKAERVTATVEDIPPPGVVVVVAPLKASPDTGEAAPSTATAERPASGPAVQSAVELVTVVTAELPPPIVLEPLAPAVPEAPLEASSTSNLDSPVSDPISQTPPEPTTSTSTQATSAPAQGATVTAEAQTISLPAAVPLNSSFNDIEPSSGGSGGNGTLPEEGAGAEPPSDSGRISVPSQEALPVEDISSAVALEPSEQPVTACSPKALPQPASPGDGGSPPTGASSVSGQKRPSSVAKRSGAPTTPSSSQRPSATSQSRPSATKAVSPSGQRRSSSAVKSPDPERRSSATPQASTNAGGGGRGSGVGSPSGSGARAASSTGRRSSKSGADGRR
jgi:hypothetical protein